MSTTMNWEEVARNLAGALDSCVTQIQQMKGMFPDDDGNIEEALQEADEASEMFSDAVAGTPKPRFYAHFREALKDGGPDAWEHATDGVPCGRFAVQEEDVALFPELAGVDSVRIWDGGIETIPPLPEIHQANGSVDETLVQSIAEKIRDAGDVLVLDDAVHAVFSGRASEINNQGLEAQIRWLLTNGSDEQAVLEQADITSPSCRR